VAKGGCRRTGQLGRSSVLWLVLGALEVSAAARGFQPHRSVALAVLAHLVLAYPTKA
jgi:hypothetical protein